MCDEGDNSLDCYKRANLGKGGECVSCHKSVCDSSEEFWIGS